MRLGTCVALALATACSQPVEPATAPDTARSPPAVARVAVDARDLFEAFECHRCHDGLPVQPVALERHCVRCHREIHSGSFDAPPDALARWKHNIVSLRTTPSLDAVGTRLKRSWVRQHVLDPADVRPALAATMPRLDMTAAQATRIAEHLVPAEAPDTSFSAIDLAAGAVLYRELGCASCHRFSGVDADPPPAHYAGGHEPTSEAIALAPDLAVSRSRFQSGRLEDWLRDPLAMKADTLMPGFELSAEQARQLAAYIVLATLEEPAPASPPERLPLLSRKVRYDEVAERVLRKTCWHCHSESDLARGDGGPGNSGGFGFAPRGLDLSSYTGVASGSLDADGKRRSVFSRDDSGTPRLLRHLLARQSEEAGAPIAGVRGMPLGLPALSPEQIQLVDTWIAQGRPR